MSPTRPRSPGKQARLPQQEVTRGKGRTRSPRSFVKNKLYALHRGFAFKLPATQAAKLYRLRVTDPDTQISPGKTGHNLVWVSPDGKRILTRSQAESLNHRRRSAATLSDAWSDFKAADPVGAKTVGWNRFQQSMKGIAGSKIDALNRFRSSFGIDAQTFGELVAAADGDVAVGERNGWGDSG